MGYTDQVAVATPRREGTPHAARWFSLALCAAAFGIGVGLVVAGARLPSLGPVLLLAIAAAVCVNRFALFPTEHAATAEAAVLLAAVVGFRSDAAFLGPLAVALLVGPLDTLHWEQRSFVRMAYNAGNRGLATLAAAASFGAVLAVGDGSTAGWVVAVVVGASAFALVDVTLSVVLLRLHGERVGSALSHVLDVDVLTMPVALAGAAAGIVAGEVGWWATVLAVLPAAFVPELVIARAHTRATTTRDLAALLTLVGVLTTVALVTPVPATATLAVLAMLAVLAGIEFVPGRGVLVPPLAATVVAAACCVLDADRLRSGAVLVAVLVTATSWWCGRFLLRVRFLMGVAVAVGGALIAAQLALELPRSFDGVIVGALVAGLAFELAVVGAAPSRRRHGAAVMWTVPVLAAAVAGAAVWRLLGLGGALVFGSMLAAALVGWAGWGAPAWRSRLAARSARRLPAGLLPWWFVMCALGAVATSLVGVVVAQHAPAPVWAWTGTGLGEIAAAMAAAGVRQWRFAPRPRRLGLLTTSTAGIALVAAPLLARDSLAGVAVVATTMGALAVVARGPSRRVRSAGVPDRERVDTR